MISVCCAFVLSRCVNIVRQCEVKLYPSVQRDDVWACRVRECVFVGLLSFTMKGSRVERENKYSFWEEL